MLTFIALSLCSSSYVDRIAIRIVGKPGKDVVFPLSTSSIGPQFVWYLFLIAYFRMFLTCTLSLFQHSQLTPVLVYWTSMRFRMALPSSFEGSFQYFRCVILFSGCSFVTKASFAQAAGAVAFISYDYMNNSARILNMVPLH